MSTDIVSKLPELKKDSGVRLNQAVKSLIQNHDKPRALVTDVQIANAEWAVKPKSGGSTLGNPLNRFFRRKVKTLSSGNFHIINQLNFTLAGGESYPVLTAVLGTAAGFASAGGSLIFTVATTKISASNVVQKVMARIDDEIWQVEEIGKVGNQPTYISSFFIVDPFRGQTPTKGWLIHEERQNVILT